MSAIWMWHYITFHGDSCIFVYNEPKCPSERPSICLTHKGWLKWLTCWKGPLWSTGARCVKQLPWTWGKSNTWHHSQQSDQISDARPEKQKQKQKKPISYNWKNLAALTFCTWAVNIFVAKLQFYTSSKVVIVITGAPAIMQPRKLQLYSRTSWLWSLLADVPAYAFSTVFLDLDGHQTCCNCYPYARRVLLEQS